MYLEKTYHSDRNDVFRWREKLIKIVISNLEDIRQKILAANIDYISSLNQLISIYTEY